MHINSFGHQNHVICTQLYRISCLDTIPDIMLTFGMAVSESRLSA